MVDTTDEITAGNKFEILNKVTNETHGNQNSVGHVGHGGQWDITGKDDVFVDKSYQSKENKTFFSFDDYKTLTVDGNLHLFIQVFSRTTLKRPKSKLKLTHAFSNKTKCPW